MFYLTIVDKLLRHCHSWLVRLYFMSSVIESDIQCKYRFLQISRLANNWVIKLES